MDIYRDQLENFLASPAFEASVLQVAQTFEFFCVRLFPASSGLVWQCGGAHLTFEPPRPGEIILQINGVTNEFLVGDPPMKVTQDGLDSVRIAMRAALEDVLNPE